MQYKVKQDLATFIEKLVKNYGEDAVLKPVEIVRFAEKLGFGRSLWLSFLKLKTSKSRALYFIPKLTDVVVVVATAGLKPKKTMTKAKVSSDGAVTILSPAEVVRRLKDRSKKVSPVAPKLKASTTKNVIVVKDSDEDEEKSTYRNTTTKRDDDAAIADVIRDHDGGRVSYSLSDDE